VMELKDLKVGETLELRIGAIVSKTKLEGVIDEDHFVVTQPSYRMIPLHFSTGEEVQFSFLRDDGLYAFWAVYEARELREGWRICYFRAVSEVKKNQRRHSYRLPIVLDVLIRIQLSDEDPQAFRELNASTVNLSEEGAALACYTRLPVRTKLLLNIRLQQNDTVFLRAEVMRAELPANRGDPYIIACKFTNLSRRLRLHISKFILQRQIRDRKHMQR
jgi:c-di-GMP-binding flagellar brake protein YcgR